MMATDYEALARQFGGQVATPAHETGFIDSLSELITGKQRATTETQTLPEWTTMPELNEMSVASLKTALGTLLSNPKETVQILQANFPSSQVRQDTKGNYIIRSSIDQKEYAIPPGLTVGDIPRVVGGILAFTPAGRVSTIPGAVLAGGSTQAAIEAIQAGAGGQFDTGEVAIAGAGGGAGQVLQRGVQALVPAARRTFQRITGAVPEEAAQGTAQTARQAAPGSAIEQVPESVPSQTVQTAPVALQEVSPIPPIMPPQELAATARTAAEGTDTGVIDVLNLARKAGGIGPGSAAAKAKLIDLAQVNPEARAAAERLGMDLPFDVFSDNPQVRSAVGLTRALVAGEAEAAWEGTVRNAIQRADDISQQFDAAFIGGRPAPGATSQRILDSLQATRDALKSDAKAIYERIDEVVPKSAPVELNNLAKYLDDLRINIGAAGRMTPQESNLAKMLEKGELTYLGLKREKDAVGQAIGGLKSPYDNMNSSDLKSLYAALAQDQLDNVAALAGEETRRELRAANLMTAKRKALENRIVGAFGKEIDGSVAQRMQTAISTASKGDATAFNRLMKVVPEDLQKETIATALAQVTAGKAAGRASAGSTETVFSPSEFTKIYRGLRSNPPVYSQMVKIMGPEWDGATRDLYEISRRIADAQARIPTTGKANQILGNAAVDGLMSKIMSSSISQRVATGVTGMVPGGGVVAPDIVQWMSSTKGDGVQKAAKLFTSPDFQRLAIEAATRPAASQDTLRRTAMSRAFHDFANAVRLPQSLDARVQWLQSAMQTEHQLRENR